MLHESFTTATMFPGATINNHRKQSFFILTMLLNECHKCLQFMAHFMDSLAAFLGAESKYLDSVLTR